MAFCSWVSIFKLRNNTIEVNLTECANKEDFSFEDLKGTHGLESESAAGKIASTLQEKAVAKVLKRR